MPTRALLHCVVLAALCGAAGLPAVAGADTPRQVGLFAGETRDADGDGVADIDDNCPDTPAQVLTPRGAVAQRIDGCGCPLDPCADDEDGDGVGFCADDCPGTYPGLAVTAAGCPAPLRRQQRIGLDVHFASSSAEIEPDQVADLERLRAALLRLPGTRVTLEGHADASGRADRNQVLSEQRAAACRDYLLAGGGIAPERIKGVGYGASRPRVDNATPEGRALNRRTVAELQFDEEYIPANDQPPPLAGLTPEK